MYVDIMNGDTSFLCKYIWKLKIILKLGFLRGPYTKKSYLRKDNIARRKHNGCRKMCQFIAFFFDCLCMDNIVVHF